MGLHKKAYFMTLTTLKNSILQNSVRKYEDGGSSVVGSGS
jgi:hypothetical protein